MQYLFNASYGCTHKKLLLLICNINATSFWNSHAANGVFALTVRKHLESHCIRPTNLWVLQARWAGCVAEEVRVIDLRRFSVPRAQDCCCGYLCLRPAWIRKRPRFLERSWLGRHTRQRERRWGAEREWRECGWRRTRSPRMQLGCMVNPWEEGVAKTKGWRAEGVKLEMHREIRWWPELVNIYI